MKRWYYGFEDGIRAIIDCVPGTPNPGVIAYTPGLPPDKADRIIDEYNRLVGIIEEREIKDQKRSLSRPTSERNLLEELDRHLDDMGLVDSDKAEEARQSIIALFESMMPKEKKFDGDNVFVIMSNDFPAGVMTDEDEADELVSEQNDLDKSEFPMRRVFWRSYKFQLDRKMR